LRQDNNELDVPKCTELALDNIERRELLERIALYLEMRHGDSEPRAERSDLSTRRCSKRGGGRSPFLHTRFSRKGSLHFISTFEPIKVWSPNTWACERTLEGHTTVVASLVMHGDKLISGSDDSTIKVWGS
jgi:WD40 repeat protein